MGVKGHLRFFFFRSGCWSLSHAFSISIEIMWCLLFWYIIFHWLIYSCWTILVTLGWIQVIHGIWYLLRIVGFGLLIFCWEFLHLYSSQLLAYNFLLWWCLCLVLISGWWWLHRVFVSVPSSKPFEEFKKDWCEFFLCLVE
mgnify:CR=1 FL=1